MAHDVATVFECLAGFLGSVSRRLSGLGLKLPCQGRSENVPERRRAGTEFAGAGDALSRAVAEERLRELEIELTEDRRLTLPPSTYP